MEGLLSDIYAIIWNPDFWLPEGTTWQILESSDPNVYYPKSKDIHWCILVGVILMVLSYVCEKILIRPWAKWIGVRDGFKKVVVNKDLEKVYSKYKDNLPISEVKVLSRQLKMREMDIQKWLSSRARQDRATPMYKFCECSWHFIFYMTMLIYGGFILRKKEWMYESKLFFKNYPHHIGNDLYYYYLIEMGFYWSQIMTLSVSVKRKDFKELVIHHFTTLALMYLSWFTGLVRVGSAVLILHDTADVWVLGAKMLKYSRRQTLAEIIFTGFAIVWIATRVVIYPYWILYSCIFEVTLFVKSTPSHSLFVGLLLILQVLHWIWTYFVIKAAAMKFQYGKVKQDARSDSESDSSEEEIQSNGTGEQHGQKSKLH